MFVLWTTESLYWSNYWERYQPVSDNDHDAYDNNYYYYDEEKIVIRPSFLQTARNISVHRGRTATLCCQVEHLGSKTVRNPIWNLYSPLMTDKYTPWTTKTCHFVFDYNSGVTCSIFIARQHTAADTRYWYSNSVRPSVCPSVCPWHAGIVWKRLNVSS